MTVGAVLLVHEAPPHQKRLEFTWHGVCCRIGVSQRKESPMQHENISAIIEQAKQQRAEYLGSAVRKHPVLTAAVAGIPVLLTQLPWGGSSPVADALRVGQALAPFLA